MCGKGSFERPRSASAKEEFIAYVLNNWYLAAWSYELAPAQAFGRVILGEQIVFFRSEAGQVAALADTCPHRFAPLSVGEVRNGAIACRYHGLAFGAGGPCASNPHGPISRNAHVQSYPIAEAHRGIWIWPGDPSLADTGKIPDLTYLSTTPETAFSCGYLPIEAKYQLVIDNILDLSHVDYLHPNTLGGGMITQTKPMITEEASAVDVAWISPRVTPPPLLASHLPPGLTTADVWQEVRWQPVGVMRLKVGAVAQGRPRSDGIENENVHIVTPSSHSSAHYFFAATRNYRVEDAELNAAIAATRARIFGTEDKPMLEMIQTTHGRRRFLVA